MRVNLGCSLSIDSMHLVNDYPPKGGFFVGLISSEGRLVGRSIERPYGWLVDDLVNCES